MAGATLAVASVAVFAGAAMADPGGQGRFGNILPQSASSENGESDDSEKKRLKDRVAEILGIETETLEDAFRQAREERFMARLDKHLDRLVEDGRLTEDEAAEIREWVEDRPDALWELLPGHGDKPFKSGWHGHGPKKGPFGLPGLISTPPAELIEERVQELEEEGELSEDDAQAIRDWLDDRPDALDKLTPGLDAASEAVNRILDRLVEDGVLSEEEAERIREHLRSAKEMLKGLDRERPDTGSERRGPNARPFDDEFFNGRPGQGPPSSFEFRGFARPDFDRLPDADETS